MNNRLRNLIVALALLAFSTLNLEFSTCFAQGSLAPPGAPAPTMKTLAQIEPRTPISSAPFTITNPGSYYLTTNLTVGLGQNAIIVATNGVTLDLNGFTLFSTSTIPNATGILINSGLSDIAIFNGHIKSGVTNNGTSFSGTGFGYGIYYLGTSPPGNTMVSGLKVSGVNYQGIYLGLGGGTIVRNCKVNISGDNGIFADTVSDSMALHCFGTAISGYNVHNCFGTSVGNGNYNGVSAFTVENCYGSSAGSGPAIDGNQVQNSYGSGNSGAGVSAYTALNCTGFSMSGIGVNAVDSAENCNCGSNTGDGLDTGTALNCIGASYGAGIGINASATVENCWGSSSSGLAIQSFLAINTYAVSDTGGGLSTGPAMNCLGASYSGSGVGLSATLANNCVGYSSGTAIQANIGIGCYASGGTNNITHKYNMP